MAISNITTFPNDPTFDDFDEKKNFKRILISPGVPVQTRELNQMQTMFQDQIDKFGQHIFKNGSPVLGGNTYIDDKVLFLKVETTFTSSSINYNITNYISEFKNTIITGITSGVQAKVIDVIGEENGDPITFFLKYVSSGSDNVSTTFLPEEELFTDALLLRRAKVKPASSNPFGNSLFCYVSEGVFFTRGTFVYTPNTKIIAGKYTTDVSKRLIFKVLEEVITTAEDETLYDNSLGTLNTNESGGNRYKISLQLLLEDNDFEIISQNNFIELLVLKEGKVVLKNYTQYSDIGEVLAQRTFEESGNFVTNPFKLDIKEHLNTGTNFGKYLSGDGGDSTKIYLGLKPSTAYVFGQRISLEDTKDIVVDKARDTLNVKNSVFSIQTNNFLTVHTVTGLPDLANASTLNFLNSGSVVIGTARVRGLEYVSGIKGTAGSSTGAIYKIYLFDVKFTSTYTKADIATLSQAVAGSHTFTATALDKSNLLKNYSSFVFPLAYNVVKTLLNETDRTTYHVTFEERAKNNGAGNSIVLTSPTNNLYVSNSPTDWQVVKNSNGLLETPTITLTGSPVGSTVTISGLSGINTDYDIIGTIRKTISQKSKTLVQDFAQAINSPQTTLGGFDNLSKADIFKIKNIYMSANLSTVATTSDTVVTSRYILDNGQRDTFYDIGRIQLKSNSIAPTGRLLVVYDYFSHSSGDYFSVDSYPIDYSLIPTYQSSESVLQLRDCIDFRPRKDDAGANFTSTGSSIGRFPLHDSLFECDLEYYLGRSDKLYVDKNGNFGISKGASSLTPISPKEPANSIGLYDIFLKPYTFSIDEVSPKIIDNRNFTKADVGDIEKRVSTLENFVKTSLFEKEILSNRYLDSLSSELLKNGFLADDFSGHTKGDVENVDYKCAIDKNNNLLTAPFCESITDLIYDSSNSTNVQKTGSLVTLPYTEVNAISQPYATRTRSVNPYGNYGWQGNIALSPSSEKWKDTKKAPYLISDISKFYSVINSRILSDEIFGSIYNEWRYNWFGYSSFDEVNSFEEQNSSSISGLKRDELSLKRISASDTIISSYGDKKVEENYVPYMRSVKVYFKAENLKPNTRVYAFLDDISIADYVKQETFVEYSVRSDTQQREDFTGLTTHPNGNSVTLVTDSVGKIEGSFIIPNNSSIVLKTGSIKFKLTSSSTNSSSPETFCEYIYNAKGKLDNSNNINISTRELYFDRSELDESKVLKSNIIRPILQTFSIREFKGGAFLTSIDLFFSKKDSTLPITLQIRPIINNIPSGYIVPFSEVTLYPSSVNISTNSSALTKFTFKSLVYLKEDVEYAIALKTKSIDYSMYICEMGRNDLIKTSFVVNKQPYSGVMYELNNIAELVKQDNNDFKFNINIAQFNISSSSNLVLANRSLPLVLLQENALSFTNASNNVIVYHKNHGLFTGAKVLLSGITSGTSSLYNISLTQLNKTHTITSATFDTYTITTVANANATAFGGGSAVLASENKTINSYYPHIEFFNSNSTSISFTDKLVTGKSVDSSSQVPFLQESYKGVKVNANNNTPYPYIIASEENETLLPVANSKSYFLKCNFTSTKNNLSPVVDLERCSIVNIANRIDNNSSSLTAELKSSNTPSLTKFIQKTISLENESDTLKVEFLANRPYGSSIELFYRTSKENENISLSNWVFLAPLDTIPVTDDKTIYNKVQFSKENLSFNNIQIKIVLKTDNSSKVPTIKKLATIGLI